MSLALDRWLDEHLDDPAAWTPAPPEWAETWAEVPGTDGRYEVSTLGRVRGPGGVSCRADGLARIYPEERWYRIADLQRAAFPHRYRRAA